MNDYVQFPRALVKPVRVKFYRFRGEGPMVTGQQTLLKTPDRYPDDVMELEDEFLTAKLGGYGDLWSREEIDQWLESEFPTSLPWTNTSVPVVTTLIAVLPDVEIPQIFKYRRSTYSAVSEWGELGFVNTVLQKCWEEVDYDDPRANPIKRRAKDAGWVFIEYRDDYRPDTKRGDDGAYDQITHAFYPGARRCGWCGSSSVIPRFLVLDEFQEPAFHCLACEADGGDSIDDRNSISLEDME
tara:strand:+ start:2303 stop:3025 length:723 start_codon:yes stop_codon:yes gene_type:complete